MSVRLTAALAGALLLLSIAGAQAQAETSVSSNWAGYAVHQSGTSYNRVVGTWRQPSATCVRGNRTYSAMWIGLGGYSATSTALEQIGTEVDCTADGKVSSSAWYELVPAPSHTVSLRVQPGDAMVANVSVTGHQVVLSLNDATRHQTLVKRLRASNIDTSSAEWIVEAPSECRTATSCQTLPLADFGRTNFALAAARTTRGHVGWISDPSWSATAIRLAPAAGQGTMFAAYEGTGPAVGTATPTAVSAAGNAFSVDFSAVSVGGGRFASRRAVAAGAAGVGQIVHPLR